MERQPTQAGKAPRQEDQQSAFVHSVRSDPTLWRQAPLSADSNQTEMPHDGETVIDTYGSFSMVQPPTPHPYDVRNAAKKTLSPATDKHAPVTTDPRQDVYDRFPRWKWLQTLFTAIYGKPYPGQTPLFKQTPAFILTVYSVVPVLSVAAGAAMTIAMKDATLVVKPVLALGILTCAMVTTGRMRALHHTILHHASHGDFGPRSRMIGEIASMVAFSMPFDEYKPKHMFHHGHTGDPNDPEIVTVAALGFVPGRDIEFYWKRLRQVFFSPKMLANHFWWRCQSNFGAGVSLKRKCIVAALHGVPLTGVVAASIATSSYLPSITYLCAWGAAWTVGMYWSLILYVLGLHVWLRKSPACPNRRAIYVQRTGARFFGDPMPARNQSFGTYCFQILRWWVRLAVLHTLISRLFTVSGNNQQHDVHHMEPKHLDHFNAAYDRERLLASGKDEYWHTWGLFPAIQLTFENLASLPPQVIQVASGV